MSLACLEAKLLHEVLLDLLQTAQAVLDLHVNLRPLEIIPNDSPYQKPRIKKKPLSLWHAWKLSYTMMISLTTYSPHRLFLPFSSI